MLAEEAPAVTLVLTVLETLPVSTIWMHWTPEGTLVMAATADPRFSSVPPGPEPASPPGAHAALERARPQAATRRQTESVFWRLRIGDLPCVERGSTSA